MQNYFEQLKKHHSTIRNSIAQSLLANLCKCKSRAHRARIKAQGPYSSQLDVKRLISNSLGYRDFIRAFLTPKQKVWLANQQSRFVSLDSDHCLSSSEEAVLTNFTPKNTFERKLVQGVLYQNGRIPDFKTKTTFQRNRNSIVPLEAHILEDQENESNANDSNLSLIDVDGEQGYEMQTRDEFVRASRVARKINVPVGRETRTLSRNQMKRVKLREPIELRTKSKSLKA